MTTPTPTGLRDPKTTRRALLRWFDAHRRELPWRGSRDPWAILVSEIMLQQTTVAAVTPYFERFLARWPAPADLARASRDELLSAWAGLGYYRRAHMLMDAATRMADGCPQDAAGLAGLPGVGEYTAAAVASIAFGEPVAAVDGNVERVVSRLAALPGDPRKAAGKRAVRRAAQALLDTRRPGDFNQAVMDLGSAICRPRDPRCEDCPLSKTCEGFATGRPERFPELPPRPKPVPVVRAVAVVRRAGKLLLTERTESPNAGFCELPGLELDGARLDEHGAPLDAGAALREWLSATHGLTLRPGEELPLHRHSITRYRLRVHPVLGTLSSGRVTAPLHWGRPDDGRPLTTATRRILSRSLPELFETESP